MTILENRTLSNGLILVIWTASTCNFIDHYEISCLDRNCNATSTTNTFVLLEGAVREDDHTINVVAVDICGNRSTPASSISSRFTSLPSMTTPPMTTPPMTPCPPCEM